MDNEIIWEYAFERQINVLNPNEAYPLTDSREWSLRKVEECLKNNGYDVSSDHSRITAVSKCLKGIYDASHDYDEYYYLDGKTNARTVLSNAVVEVLDRTFPQDEDWALFVSCEDCDQGEEQGADDPRHHIELFVFDSYTEIFTCKQCGKVAQQEYYDHNEEGGAKW